MGRVVTVPSVAKFYLHDAATPNSGTMPTGVFLGGGDGTGDATGARTTRDATDVVGVSQTSSLITAVANTSLQQWGHRRFVSRPLAAQTFATADGNWTASFAAAESNTSHNGNFSIQIFAWRPSTGLQVGVESVQIFNVPLSATAETAKSATGTWSGTQAILDGDVLVFEVWDQFSQGMATAYTSSFFYDGTTEASATSCASFVTPPAALTLFSAAVATTLPSAHLPFMQN